MGGIRMRAWCLRSSHFVLRLLLSTCSGLALSSGLCNLEACPAGLFVGRHTSERSSLCVAKDTSGPYVVGLAVKAFAGDASFQSEARIKHPCYLQVLRSGQK